MKTVLIFAHECAPHHNMRSVIGAQRPAQFAKYLGEFGWRAVVLCCDNERRRWPDREKALTTARANAQKALETTPADAPLIIATPSLAHDGWLDRCWRATFTDHGPRRSQPVVLARKALTALKFKKGDWSQSWQPCGQAAAQVLAANLKIDVCLAEHGPDASLFLARWFAAQYGAPWLIDFRDPMVQQFRGLTRKLYTRAARDLLSTAGGTIAVNPFLTQLDQEMFGRPAWTITNGFDPSEFAETQTPPKTGPLTVAYPGNVIPEQRLDIFVAGLREAAQTFGADSAQFLRFVYCGGRVNEVRQLAEQHGVSQLFEGQAHVARPVAIRMMQQADVLLLLSVAVPEQADLFLSRGIYPGKTFEYFGAARPILCVPGDGAMLDELMAETQTGTMARNPSAVAEFLVTAAALKQVGAGLPYQPNRDLVNRYTRRNLAGQLAAILTQATRQA